MRKILSISILFAFLSLAFSGSAFALDVKSFHKDLNDWACITAYLDVVMHPGFPHNSPMNSNLPQRLEELDKVKRSVMKVINGIETTEELATAQKVADEFRAMHSFEREIGEYVSQLLKERAKYISLQLQ
ncbi:MAG: hypothetical protein HQM10_00715 [Candidatus Riflebacteria bacterium]|nr:hypothetical protein [Candidatus Riflebacteria bacterium]